MLTHDAGDQLVDRDCVPVGRAVLGRGEPRLRSAVGDAKRVGMVQAADRGDVPRCLARGARMRENL